MTAERYDLWTIDDHAPAFQHRARQRGRNLTRHTVDRRAAELRHRYGRDGYALRVVVVPAGASLDINA